ncbi:hypothetical protein [Fusibacter sp. 3D3]|uniref:hypothetical protein n=1 Tax=Fusibacter sp. 3D3 TaxID=1048380 RepID=UPI000853CBE0|nr:hypothetical protein [Fusibacter sp. 3D3]GAU78500.1 DNA topology modulation protein [Fusibacter sp. 3D3]
MKKIYIIGIVGAGKTTFSRNLSRKLNIHPYEIDEIAYKQTEKGRLKQSDEEQIATFKRINEKHIWIIEGTYRPSCQYLLENADTIIFLDPPLYVRKIRIIKRFLKQQLGIETSPYKSDLKMLKAMFKWTHDFEKNRKDFEMLLKTYGSKLIVIRSRRELKKVLEQDC